MLYAALVILVGLFVLMMIQRGRIKHMMHHAVTTILWIVLEMVDVALRVISCILSVVLRYQPSSSTKPKVVVIGGSFAGLAASQKLASKCDVTLVDFKNYFEYTPGILRAFVDPKYLSQITCSLDTADNLVSTVCAKVEAVESNQIVVSNLEGDQSTIPFDYLMVGSGSLYSHCIKPTPEEPTLSHRMQTWENAAQILAEASSVLVIGGGPVGVELVGEIVTKYPRMKVTIVDAGKSICGTFPSKAVEHMTSWLSTKGVDLVLGEWITSIDDNGCTLKSGRRIDADVVYRCMGFKPNSGFLQKSFADQLDQKGALRVSDTLQVEGRPKVYGMGDICIHKRSSELKLGHTAELNAHLAASNILREEKKQTLLEYPNGVVQCSMSPQIYCVSLGQYDGVLIFNGVVLGGMIGGPIAAVMKWMVEWTKVAAAAGRPIGVHFWNLADCMSVLISRWVLPLPDPQYEDVSVVLFDGECALCDGFVSFVISQDTSKHFKFASLQSDVGGALLTQYGLSSKDLSSMVMINKYGHHRQSSAAVRTIMQLGWPWLLIAPALLIPAPLRNLAYKLVANYRYTLFGKIAGADKSTAALKGRLLAETKC